MRPIAQPVRRNNNVDPACRQSPGGSYQMHCPSCGAISENADCCAILGTETNQNHEIEEFELSPGQESLMNSVSDTQTQSQSKKSTLIEFPGANRHSLPEWRKGLSERVREVQERRAREAAREAATTESPSNDSEAIQPQLELLPPAEMPEMNPLVAAALKRIERAHQSTSPDPTQQVNVLATAVAYAPAREEREPEVLTEVTTPQLIFDSEVEEQIEVGTIAPPQIEKSHNLVVVATIEPEPDQKHLDTKPAPKRLIVDDPNDPALNYLDSISRTVRVDEVDTQRPAAFRRFVCAFFDLIICALFCAPIAFAMRVTGSNLQDLRVIEVLAGSLVVVTFIYLTLSTALTGRTFAMRLFSLRVIDTKTGLIPTGSQSVGRSFLYLISIALAGLGILFALISREGQTAHDRFTRTAVILT